MKNGKMKIAVLVPVWGRIPPKGYGGIEEVVAILCKGLAQRGHEVVLFASGDSRIEGVTTEAVFDENLKECIGNPAIDQHHVRESITKILEDGKFDLISNHAGYTLITIARFANELPPIVTTLHGRVNKNNWPFFAEVNSDSYFVTISENQRKKYPLINHLRTIYNAIDFSRFPKKIYQQNREDYFIYLSRCSPEKGTHLALEVAKRAGIKLLMCCKVDECDYPYYENVVKPHIDGGQILWKEEVSVEEKISLIAKARGFIFPLQWSEPFGLVALEAMACGTPFITFPLGAMPELGVNRESYFLCGPPKMNNMRVEDAMKEYGQAALDEMVEVVKVLNSGELLLDAVTCRKQAEKFSPERMINAYEEAYLEVCQQNNTKKKQPAKWDPIST